MTKRASKVPPQTGGDDDVAAAAVGAAEVDAKSLAAGPQADRAPCTRTSLRLCVYLVLGGQLHVGESFRLHPSGGYASADSAFATATDPDQDPAIDQSSDQGGVQQLRPDPV
jgi:hypothetical protein